MLCTSFKHHLGISADCTLHPRGWNRWYCEGTYGEVRDGRAYHWAAPPTVTPASVTHPLALGNPPAPPSPSARRKCPAPPTKHTRLIPLLNSSFVTVTLGPKTVWLSWIGVHATRVRFREARLFCSDDILPQARFMTMLGVSGVELLDR